MENEIEARACRHAFMTSEHHFPWVRALGPMISWTTFFAFAFMTSFWA